LTRSWLPTLVILYVSVSVEYHLAISRRGLKSSDRMKKPKRTRTKRKQWAVREPKPATKRQAAGLKPWADPLPPAQRMERNRKAAVLLREWMADASGYDEAVWPALEQALKEDPIRFREDA